MWFILTRREHFVLFFILSCDWDLSGSEALNQLIVNSAAEGRPIACLGYTSFLPWAAAVARSLQVPPVLLWIQPAAVLDIYYFYFNGYGEIIRKNITDPSYCIELPGLPLLNGCDLPSFTLPSNAYPFLLSSLQEQLDAVSLDINPKILVNTFHELEPEKLSCRKEMEQKGMIVSWCSQLEVLTHPSVGCFVTHCGWNSSLESLVCGIPVVAIPQWTDQTTNAKMMTNMWKTGVRVAVNGEGIVEGDETMRCMEFVMGDRERGGEMRRNVEKWKDRAKEAAKDDGYSYNNIKAFVDEFGQDH